MKNQNGCLSAGVRAVRIVVMRILAPWWRLLPMPVMFVGVLMTAYVVWTPVTAGAAPAAWSDAGTMTKPRAGTDALVLRDGRVLVPGGSGAVPGGIDVDIFEPATRTWSRSASGPGSNGGLGTLLADDRVLISGPQTVDDLRARVYDAVGDTWSWTGPMTTYQWPGGTVRLADGRVLALGGTAGRPSEVATVQAYNPATNAWSALPDMPDGRERLTATLLDDARVLVAGGTNEFECGCSPQSFLFAPEPDDWIAAPDMLVGRVGNTATRLADGRVVVTGGGSDNIGPVIADTEIYDPATNAWVEGPPMSTPRALHTATLLRDGRVLVAGGVNAQSAALATTEFYDPATNAWSPGPAMQSQRRGHAATLMSDGRVLVAGGSGRDRRPLASAEILTLPPAPHAVLDTGALPAVAGGDVILDASGSRDPSDLALSFVWDLDGDERYETPGGPRVAHAFPEPGLYRVGVHVTAAGGQTASATATIDVRAFASTAQGDDETHPPPPPSSNESGTPPPRHEGRSAGLTRQAVYAQLHTDQKRLRGAIRKLRRTGAATMHITLPAAGVEHVRLHTTGNRRHTIAYGRVRSTSAGPAHLLLHVTSRGKKLLHGDKVRAVRITSQFVSAGLNVTASAPLVRG
ncbi:kelch repeat-containing protein [Capillimicrobium parvum]|uniref:PKD domain-containing protein n=1 Tax=Capillimicrobium parvum TaxID=2884022 RepID=A0A9E6Y270_9ACTN|nr:kelch repeat-containing protein [Capillimicrobium parvum]UGS38197.1 hypothetical protein DSM104329_04620 [Capillimicrobium parvum]